MTGAEIDNTITFSVAEEANTASVDDNRAHSNGGS